MSYQREYRRRAGRKITDRDDAYFVAILFAKKRDGPSSYSLLFIHFLFQDFVCAPDLIVD